jgi:hypothetical protein
MALNSGIQVTFDAVEMPGGKWPTRLRVIIPKEDYLLAAEDDGYYYLQPVEKGETTNGTTT